MGHYLLLMLDFQEALGNRCRLLGKTLGRGQEGVRSFSPDVSAGQGVSLLAQEGWHAQVSSGPGIPSSCLRFSAQWGSSQIKRHLYCRVVSACNKDRAGSSLGPGQWEGPGVRPDVETHGQLFLL